ncbi:glycosyltransferase involved in cell wall biosynthesis [Phyllobacterium ifriqiyense]|uniref:Glycosyltransferase involved in cell wall biosynthesis n=1 Tax=Phyllobacterium ifriqiyense TaxID=314238 RepID=A0ABU0S7Y5_9HYPH|nr:glycosyltransferase family A protein [Phyllobacterium ifriqiyense]MDQ0996858.1 glycosyltransferase involved in cell wall biosynthesis [Phyllobacterium ifriqiyense]
MEDYSSPSISKIGSKVTETSLKRPIDTKVPTVVVVIPFYNGSEFIERAVQSVLNQTVAPNEFIVVNDGSTENEKQFLHDLSTRYEFRVIDQINGGQGSARNAGVANSKSDFICFLDQDDFYLKTHIQSLVEAIPENDPHFGWVYGDLIEAEGDGNVIRTSMVREHSKHPKTHILDLLRNDMHVLPSASLISRTAFEAVGGFDPQFMGYEDDDLFLRIFRKNFTNTFIDKSVTVWCIHTESTSYGIRMSRSRLRYFKKLAAAFPDDPIKRRFYMRDVFIPRFHNQIVSEAIVAATQKDSKFAQHKDELIGMYKEYVDIVCASPAVSEATKRKLRAQARLLSTGSSVAIKAAHFGVRTLQGLRKIRLR